MRIDEVMNPISPQTIAAWLAEMRVIRASNGTMHLSDVGSRTDLTRCGRKTDEMESADAGEAWATLATTARRCGSCVRNWKAHLDHAA